MKPRSKYALLAVLLAMTAGAEERQPSLSHDWTQMTENERFCVVPSNQQQPKCAWVGPTLYEVAKNYRKQLYDKALPQFESAARNGQTWGMWGAAIMYWAGQGTKRDAARAYGLAEAANQLGDQQGQELVRRLLPEMSGADLLRSERTTQEFVAFGEVASHVLSQWGAERLGIVVDPAAVPRDENAPDCTGRVPSVHTGAHRVKQADAKPVDYPIFDQIEGRESDTIVAILVGRSGKACRAKVVDSINGSTQTNRWALQQAQSWTFEAPRIEGQPVESVYMVRLRNRLSD